MYEELKNREYAIVYFIDYGRDSVEYSQDITTESYESLELLLKDYTTVLRDKKGIVYKLVPLVAKDQEVYEAIVEKLQLQQEKQKRIRELKKEINQAKVIIEAKIKSLGSLKNELKEEAITQREKEIASLKEKLENFTKEFVGLKEYDVP
jgi:DNA repair exonuclease SbcCD ATPase subunit